MRSVLILAGLLAGSLSTGSASAQQDLAANGEAIYFDNCAICHGLNLQNSGKTFDLKKLTAGDKGRFVNSVLNGKREMPPWRDVLQQQEIDAVWAYIRANAYQK